MSARKKRRSEEDTIDGSLLDIVDHVLTKGVVLNGDLVLGVADIDLVYLRLSAVLCAADRILGPSPAREGRDDEGTLFSSRAPIAKRLGRVGSRQRKKW